MLKKFLEHKESENEKLFLSSGSGKTGICFAGNRFLISRMRSILHTIDPGAFV